MWLAAAIRRRRLRRPEPHPVTIKKTAKETGELTRFSVREAALLQAASAPELAVRIELSSLQGEQG